MSRIIKMRDRVSAQENSHIGGFRGEVIFGTGRHLVEYTNPFGQRAVRTEFDKELYRGPNIVPIGGYQFAFDKLFNIGLDQESTLRVGDLNDEAPQMKIGVQRANYRSIYYDAESSVNGSGVIVNAGVNISALNFIFGFMIGDGGAREDNVTAIAPDYKRRSLYRAVPFRMSNDGVKLPAGKYYGRSQTIQGNAGMDPITSYYVKRFDDPAPRIVHVWVTDNPNELSVVDDSVFASTSSLPIESYVEINLSVDKDDGRGFFTSTESSPRINEFALVSGWYNAKEDDYESIRMFTHFTRPSIALSDGDAIEAIYRLYAR
ncbi:MAG: hypothetical protein NC548_42695 [Lachnospiraceae bacterium]|nr:hypothetical protein [Lachnospiraceae bacterium]